MNNDTTQLVIKHNDVWCAIDVCEDLSLDQLEGFIAGLNSQLTIMRTIREALTAGKNVEDEIPF